MTHHALAQCAVASLFGLFWVALVCDSLAARQLVRQRDDREAMKNFLSSSDRARADMGRVVKGIDCPACLKATAIIIGGMAVLGLLATAGAAILLWGAAR